MPPSSRSAWSWAMYDWANSAFATTVMAGFFPLFFRIVSSSGSSHELSTARLGIASSVGTALIVFLAPFLGALADAGGYKKRFLALFTLIGSGLTIALAFLPTGAWEIAIGVYVTAAVAFAACLCFYDSLLPSVATRAQVERVSARGFALGYFGGGLLFLINVWMFQSPQTFGLQGPVEAVRASFVSVGIWWALFSIPLWLGVSEPAPPTRLAFSQHVRQAWTSLSQTLRHLRQMKTVVLFLIAFYFYNDGVGTVMKMSTVYGLSIGLKAKDLIMALLLVQFVAFPATLLAGKLAEFIRPKTLIFIGIGLYMVAVVAAIGMTTPREFYGLAIGIGCIQGGIQAISRAFYARLIPANRSAEFFGFYNLMGKFSGLLGPAMVGMVGYALGSTRWGIASILLLFIAGAIVLIRVPHQEAVQ